MARTCADGTHRLKHLLRRQRPVAPEESRGPVPRRKHFAPGTNYVEVVVSASYEARLPDNEVLRTMHEAVRTGNNELDCNCLDLCTQYDLPSPAGFVLRTAGAARCKSTKSPARPLAVHYQDPRFKAFPAKSEYHAYDDDQASSSVAGQRGPRLPRTRVR